jgi:hypothetical protein
MQENMRQLCPPFTTLLTANAPIFNSLFNIYFFFGIKEDENSPVRNPNGDSLWTIKIGKFRLPSLLRKKEEENLLTVFPNDKFETSLLEILKFKLFF